MTTTYIENDRALNHPCYPGKTIGDARAAFDRVCSKTNWKESIDATIICTLGEAMFIRYSCEFMCGEGCKVVRAENDGPWMRHRFTHPGYYAVIGA